MINIGDKYTPKLNTRYEFYIPTEVDQVTLVGYRHPIGDFSWERGGEKGYFATNLLEGMYTTNSINTELLKLIETIDISEANLVTIDGKTINLML